MNYAAFVVQFPEFAGADQTFVTAFLTAANLEIDRDLWGVKGDQGQAYLAAHKLALSPYGQNARMVASDGKTTYWTHYAALRRQVSSGFRVA